VPAAAGEHAACMEWRYFGTPRNVQKNAGLSRRFDAAVHACAHLMSMSFSFLPFLRASLNQRGRLPRPDQVSVGLAGLKYFGGILPVLRRALRRVPNTSSKV